jgi:polar amino acid transport system substrate-binding protein
MLQMGHLCRFNDVRSGKADVWASNPGTMQAIADGLPGAKIVPGAYATARYAVGLPKGRSAEAQGRLAEIVREAKRTGVVQKAIDQAGFESARVAPD